MAEQAGEGVNEDVVLDQVAGVDRVGQGVVGEFPGEAVADRLAPGRLGAGACPITAPAERKSNRFCKPFANRGYILEKNK